MTQQKKLRVIVFDDASNIRSMLKVALSAMGHYVLTYENPTICEVYNLFRERLNHGDNRLRGLFEKIFKKQS